ncbi:PAX3- and PAX7-binding protein 1 [Thelohanellus kitauei]|uniref:PAX3-and PAX7-binding protein 1 n=1 Tax=Thelohanellus kitauei TaxID=669202 RepID=A0A0C2MUQ1_THEKT|nr:PAX3- and PAX7-binding protein 1 [Thelohanellus kitauei]
MGDVHSDFVELDNVLQIFDKWRQDFTQSYTQTFVSSSLYKLLDPIIRINLISWNPLKDQDSIENLDWFIKLVKYCTSLKDSNGIYLDFAVIPNIFDSVIAQKLTTFIKVWDCFSAQESVCLCNHFKFIYIDNPLVNVSSNINKFLKELYNRMIEFCDFIFMPIFPARLIENEGSGALDFLIHQIQTSVQFLENCILWVGILDMKKLKNLVIVNIINRFIVLGLTQITNIFISINIFETVPLEWFKDPSDEDARILPNFMRAMQNILVNLQQTNQDDHEGIEKIRLVII